MTDTVESFEVFAPAAIDRSVGASPVQTASVAIPAGMVAVTQAEFFALLKADRRDIMPRLTERNYTTWEVVATRSRWGWSTPGWANAGDAKTYAVNSAALAKAEG